VPDGRRSRSRGDAERKRTSQRGLATRGRGNAGRTENTRPHGEKKAWNSVGRGQVYPLKKGALSRVSERRPLGRGWKNSVGKDNFNSGNRVGKTPTAKGPRLYAAGGVREK